ncbi:asparagine synthetase B [Persicobacter sp. CCB-QB2]|uniref:asparagine synthetase B family protein n=1 Tax=Persicobacter sp. CCB-QB2 TaxID=1561025 RepID=UPI0006A9FA1C|nr:asparagine synthase-related protein [Persicobacter sp. CCB-QB2]
MSAIHAIWDRQGVLTAEVIERMLQAAEGYGNSAGRWEVIHMPEGQIFLGVNNLLLDDKDIRSLQPVSTKERTRYAAMDGQLFNYHDIKNQLVSEGAVFGSMSVAEVWMKWEEKTENPQYSEVNGDFAGFYVDKSVNKLKIVDNSYGSKQIFNYQSENFWVFSTSLSSVIASGLTDKALDQVEVAKLLSQGYVSEGATIYKNVKNLTWGTQLQLSCGKEGWQFSTNVCKSVDNYFSAQTETDEEGLKEALIDTLFMETSGDKNIGLLFTGGQMSTTLAALGREAGIRPALAYGLAVDPSEVDQRYADYKFAEDTSYEEGLALYQDLLTEKSLEHWEDYISQMEVPCLRMSGFIHYLLAQFIDGRSEVVLSAEGGNTLLGADNATFGFGLYLEKYDLLKSWIPMIKKLEGVLPSKSFLPVKKHLDLIHLLGRHIDESPSITAQNLFSLFGDSAEGDMGSDYKALREWQFKQDLPGRLYVESSQFYRQNGIEVRYPFLNELVLEEGLKSARHFNSEQNATVKHWLKNWAKEKVAARPHYDSRLPLANYLKSGKADIIKHQLQKEDALVYQYLDFEEIQGMLKAAEKGKAQFEDQLWAAAVMGAWLDFHFGE